MYEEKLKKEFFEKVDLYLQKKARVEELLKLNNVDLDDATEDQNAKFYDANEEYRNLWEQIESLDKEIQSLLIETKYQPLCGLSEEQIEKLHKINKSLLECPELWENVQFGQNIGDVLFGEEMIGKFLDQELFSMREEMKKRIGKLKSFGLSPEIDARTRFLYKQIALCYTYGFFDACCVLCRALAESIAKKYIESKGYLLKGEHKTTKDSSIPAILREIGSSTEIIKLYQKISSRADQILHDSKPTLDNIAKGEDAISSINTLHDFLNKFPRRI